MQNTVSTRNPNEASNEDSLTWKIPLKPKQPSYPHGRGSVSIPSPIRSARRLAHSPES